MKALFTTTTDRQEGGNEPPLMYKSHQGNPLRYRTAFEPGDAIRATNGWYGLEIGQEYPILGYWLRQDPSPNGEDAMYLYVGESAISCNKNLRSAVEEEKTHEEVLFHLLPDHITEICLNDHLRQRPKHHRYDKLGSLEGLEYLPCMGVEVPMKRHYGGLHEKGREQDAIIPLTDEKGQYSLFFNVA